jgi:hypothetical protein
MLDVLGIVQEESRLSNSQFHNIAIIGRTTREKSEPVTQEGGNVPEDWITWRPLRGLLSNCNVTHGLVDRVCLLSASDDRSGIAAITSR